MAPPSGRARRNPLALGAAIVLLLVRIARSEDFAPEVAQGGSPERSLLLAVVVNGRDIGLLGSFTQRGAALLTTRRELRALGLVPAANSTAGDDTIEPLDTLPGITYQLDERRQVLLVVATPKSLIPTDISGRTASTLPPLQSDTGMVLNYNVVTTSSGAHTVVQGQFDARVFTAVGVGSTGLLLQDGGGFLGTHNAIRLDSTYTYSDPDTLRRVRVGDLITGGLAWSRPVRLGGIQVTTDFALRSDLVTFPVPTIAGQVAVPSSVDVLLNGVQLLSRNVQPGPFELRQLPVVTGAGSVSVAITNALGQQVTQTLPFYASNALLARGLTSFSAETGSVRIGYGVLSDDYRGSAASGTYRRGLADWLTLEAHGEASPSIAMVGGGASVAVGHAGVFSFSAAFSSTRVRGGRGGGLAYAAFERISTSISLTGSIQLATPGFHDLAASYGDPVPQLTARAGFGLSLGKAGSLGLQFTVIRRGALTTSLSSASSAAAAQAYYPFFSGAQTAITPATRTTLLSASYSRAVFSNRAYFYATAFADISNRHSMGAVIGITIPLGRRTSVSVNASAGPGQSYGTAQVTQSAAQIGEFGYAVSATAGQQSRQFAEAQYRASDALIEVGVDRNSGRNSYRGSAQGALAVADGQLFAANTIYDSFAVVDTAGIAGIRVMQENRLVGTTSGSGTQLVTDLRSFEANRIDIDPRDVPMDASFTTPTQIVRPRDRSGVVVKFALTQTHGALVQLVDRTGQPLPVGSHAVLEATQQAATVGFDGEAFITGLGDHNMLTVKRQGGSACTVRFEFAPHPGALPKLGPLPCMPVAP